jgi:hypothetical protein
MHLLVILLQQLLGLLPNKQQAQPEPVRVRTAPPQNRGEHAPSGEQQAFQAPYFADLFRNRTAVSSRSTASTRPNGVLLANSAVLRAQGAFGGGGPRLADATPVDGTLPSDRSPSSASSISLKPVSWKSVALSPESHA